MAACSVLRACCPRVRACDFVSATSAGMHMRLKGAQVTAPPRSPEMHWPELHLPKEHEDALGLLVHLPVVVLQVWHSLLQAGTHDLAA